MKKVFLTGHDDGLQKTTTFSRSISAHLLHDSWASPHCRVFALVIVFEWSSYSYCSTIWPSPVPAGRHIRARCMIGSCWHDHGLPPLSQPIWPVTTSLLAGKPDVPPFPPVNRTLIFSFVWYTQCSFHSLYFQHRVTFLWVKLQALWCGFTVFGFLQFWPGFLGAFYTRPCMLAPATPLSHHSPHFQQLIEFEVCELCHLGCRYFPR